MSKRRVENWLLGYSKYTEGTEPPAIFHLWVGISCIVAAMQRKIYIDHQFFKTNSNMYIVLVGPSGTRKSTALRLGKQVLQIVPAFGTPLKFSTNAGSTAGLIQQFIKLKDNEHQSLTTFSGELGSFIRTTDTDIVGFLTDIYDCEPGWDKQTIGRGLELIEKPWLNLLGATTPDWMTENLGKLSIEGGFVRRVLFVYAEEHGLIPDPAMTDEQVVLMQDLAHDLSVIAALKGKVTYRDAEAKEFYNEWYMDPKRLANKDSRLRGYYECKSDHVRKVAMTLSLSESDSLLLSKENIDTAITLLNELETGMTKALSSVGKNPFNTDIDRVVDQVLTRGKVSYKSLFSLNVHALKKAEFDEILNTLAEIDRVVLHNGVIFSPPAWALEKKAQEAK